MKTWNENVQRRITWNWTIIGPLHEEELEIIEKEFMKQDETHTHKINCYILVICIGICLKVKTHYKGAKLLSFLFFQHYCVWTSTMWLLLRIFIMFLHIMIIQKNKMSNKRHFLFHMMWCWIHLCKKIYMSYLI
jgi:uncharacterized membrane protein